MISCYKDAWDNLLTILNGIKEVSRTVDVDKLQELMFNLENKIQEQSQEH